MAGKKYPSITRRFKEKYGFGPLGAWHALRLVEKLKKKYSLLNQKKAIQEGESMLPTFGK